MELKMLQFSESFFCEETRWGFTVSKTMKHAWAAEMEVLQRIIEICERHDLNYYVFWGTLLGAVRHEGFIPWDDDIDIALKREDYVKFLNAAEKELPSGYLLRNVYTDEEWTNAHTLVNNSQEIEISPSRLAEFHGCPFIVGVDIFPLDYIPRDEEAAELQKTLLWTIGNMMFLLEDVVEKEEKGTEEERQESRKALEEGLSTLEEWCKVSIDRDGSVANQLRRLYDRICMMYGEKDGDILTSYSEYIKGEGFTLPKEWFGTKQMKFENMTVTVPSDYDLILKELFGDYMVPVQNTQDHDYPFYKSQLQMLHDHDVWLDVKE